MYCSIGNGLFCCQHHLTFAIYFITEHLCVVNFDEIKKVGTIFQSTAYHPGSCFAITIYVCLNRHICYSSGSNAVAHRYCSCPEMQWLRVLTFAGRVLRQRQCRLEGAQYVNAQGGVQYSVESVHQ